MEGQSASEEYQLMKQQQENSPETLYADSMREEKVTNVISQIDPSNLLGEIEHRLRGEKFNQQEQAWEPISKTSKPLSPELISKLISFLGSVLNQNTTLSNYSIHEVNNRMEMVIDYLRDDLSDNDEKYGIEGDYTEMTRIGMIMCEAVSSVFRRALNGMESKRIFSALKVTESLTTPNKPGIKEAFKFW
jgi:hypothetical protein